MARKRVKPAISPRGPLRERTTMRLSHELMKDLKAIARSQDRSVSNLVERALDEFARKHRPKAVAGDLFD